MERMEQPLHNNDRLARWLRGLIVIFPAGGGGASYYYGEPGWLVIGGLMALVLGIIYIAHVFGLVKASDDEGMGSSASGMFERLGDNGGGVNTNGTHMADNYSDIHGNGYGLGDD